MTQKITSSSAASLAFLALSLAACGAEHKPAEPAPAPYQDAMNKARAVEGTLQQEKQNLDRTLQEQENPAAR